MLLTLRLENIWSLSKQSENEIRFRQYAVASVIILAKAGVAVGSSMSLWLSGHSSVLPLIGTLTM
jgi:hypothetical protein